MNGFGDEPLVATRMYSRITNGARSAPLRKIQLSRYPPNTEERKEIDLLRSNQYYKTHEPLMHGQEQRAHEFDPDPSPHRLDVASD